MAIPAMKVETRISLGVEDNASAGIKSAHSALKDFGHEAEGTGAKFHEMGEQGAAGLSKVSRLGRPLAGFAGEAKGEVTELSHAMHGFAMVTELLPGPLGMAAGAVVGLAAGAYLLNKHLDETAAKMELLVTPEARQMGEQLGLSTDGVLKLTKALSAFTPKDIKPTNEMLKEVGENAERLGQDKAENIAKFLAAWKEGPDAIKKVQEEIGTLNLRVESLSDVSKSLGFDPALIGLDKAVTVTDRLKQNVQDISKERADVVSTEETLNKLLESDALDRWQTRDAAMEQRQELERQLEVQKAQVAASEMLAKSQAKILAVQQEISEFQKLSKILATDDENRAQLAGSKHEAHKIRLKAIDDERVRINKEMYAWDSLRAALGDKEVDQHVYTLAAERQLQDIKEKAEKKAQKADAQEAGQKAMAAAEKVAAHRIALAKAVGDVEEQERHRAAGDDPVKQAAAHIRDLEAATHREIEAIRADLKKKEDVRKTEIYAAEGRLADEKAKLARDALSQQEQENTELLDADQKRDMARLQHNKQYLIAQGDQAGAAAAQELLDKMTLDQQLLDEDRAYAAKMLTLTDETARAKAALVRDSNKELLRLNAENGKGREGKTDQENAARGYAALEAAANAANSAGGKGATALGGLAKSSAALNKEWEQTKKAGGGIADMAPSMVEAAGSIAAGFVDGEKTKAGIMAITEFAAGWASYPNPVGMASHFTAAAIYGSIAGGIIGTGGSSAPSGGAPGGGSGGSPFGPGGGDQQPQNVNVFLGVLGTQQQVGLAAQRAIQATARTGYTGKGI